MCCAVLKMDSVLASSLPQMSNPQFRASDLWSIEKDPCACKRRRVNFMFQKRGEKREKSPKESQIHGNDQH